MIGSAVGSGGWRRTAGALALAFGAVALAAAPSTALDQGGCLEEATTVRVSEKLVHQADALAEEESSWETAGELMLEAASLRLECSPERHEALRTAARYFQYAGAFGRASDASFEAGQHCVWNGHVSAAAEAFIESATYAQEAGDHARRIEAAGYAVRLAGSPHLTYMQRLAIRGRADRLLGDG